MDEAEKGEYSANSIKDSAPSPSYSGNGGEPNYEETTEVHQSLGRRMWDSFKRDPNLRVTPKGVVGANGRVFDPDIAAEATANSPLARKLKGRHLQMIAIGGSIGMFYKRDSIIWAPSNAFRYWSFRRIWQGS
jgi:yeast amino acid transporter